MLDRPAVSVHEHWRCPIDYGHHSRSRLGTRVEAPPHLGGSGLLRLDTQSSPLLSDRSLHLSPRYSRLRVLEFWRQCLVFHPRRSCSCRPAPPISPTTTRPVCIPSRTARVIPLAGSSLVLRASTASRIPKPSMDSSSGIIFMRLGIAKIHQETITQELGNVSVKTLDDFSTRRLIGSDHVPVLFGVELAGESRRIHQITKHHRELPSFRVGGRCSRTGFNQWGGLFMSSRLWCWLSRLRGQCLSACRVTSPDESLPFVISHWMHVEEFILQVFEIVVIEVKASLEGTIGHTSLALQ